MKLLARCRAILRTRTGASLPFVLAIMLLLTAIGASALAAASSSSGSGIGKVSRAQLELASDSLHKSIMYSLQNAGDDQGKDVDKAQTLGGQMMNDMYDTVLNHGSVNKAYTIVLNEVTLEGKEIAPDCKVSIQVEPRIAITPQGEWIDTTVDEDGKEVSTSVRTPQMADLKASVTVFVKMSIRGKQMVSASSYAYSGGYLEDDGIIASTMLIRNTGNWRFVSYEATNSKGI